MKLVFHSALIGIILLAALFDIKERRIPNWLILAAVIVAAVMSATQGKAEILISVVGFVVGLASLVIPFALGWMGAGDVKLLGAIGALLGCATLPRVLFYSCLVAGSIALLSLAVGYARQFSVNNFWIDCKFLVLTTLTGLPNRRSLESKVYSVPWGVAIGAGTVMAYYIDSTGTWAGF